MQSLKLTNLYKNDSTQSIGKEGDKEGKKKKGCQGTSIKDTLKKPKVGRIKG